MSSHAVSIEDLPAKGEKVDVTKMSSALSILPLVGAAGLLISLVVFFTPGAGSFAYSWLFAFYYFFTIACGGFFWTMLHHATNSGWGVAIRRVMEHLASMLPFLFVLALPIILLPQAREALYEWIGILNGTAAAHPDMPMKEALMKDHHALLAHKHAYLNLPFFLLRFFLYALILGGGAMLFKRLSTRQDEVGGVKITLVTRRIACGMILFFALSVTFMAFDLLMGLNYIWFSTMWGVYLFAGSAVSGMAVIILTISGLRNLGYLHHVVSKEHYHIMGKLMKACVIFWAYISFSQFFLYWYANITEETQFFILRNTGPWYPLSLFLVVGHFVVPFLFLLRQHAKKDLKQVNAAACWILFVHLLDIYWIILPERGPSLTGGEQLVLGIPAFLGDVLAFVTVGSIILYLFLRTIGKHSIYPCRDPRLVESVNLTN
ncbi:MAG: hypothetical protein AAGJ79_09170 [Verrucomicrobiota bacterium]